MVYPKDTAEEQLLKLIEGTPPGGIPRPSLKAAGDRWRAFLDRFRFPKKFRRASADPFLRNLQIGSRLVWVVLLLLIGYLLSDALSPQGLKRKPLVPTGTESAPSTPAQTSPKPEDSLTPLSVYISSAGARNPFTPPTGSAPVTPQVRPVSNRLQELSEGLVVVRIDRSDNPRALIEDTKGNRTYFVRVGEQINGMTVSRVSDSWVTLSYEGKEIDLPY